MIVFPVLRAMRFGQAYAAGKSFLQMGRPAKGNDSTPCNAATATGGGSDDAGVLSHHPCLCSWCDTAGVLRARMPGQTSMVMTAHLATPLLQEAAAMMQVGLSPAVATTNCWCPRPREAAHSLGQFSNLP